MNRNSSGVRRRQAGSVSSTETGLPAQANVAGSIRDRAVINEPANKDNA